MSPAPSQDAIREALKKVIDPELRRDVVELGMVGELQISRDGDVVVEIILTIPGCPLKANLESQVRTHVAAVEGVTSVTLSFGHMSEQQRPALRQRLQPNSGEQKGISVDPRTRVLAIASGKGGVGKSSL